MVRKISALFCAITICISLLLINIRPIFLGKGDSLEVYLSNSSSGEIIRLSNNLAPFINGVKGESFRVDKNEFDLTDFLTEFDGHILFAEEIEQGTSYYGYSKKIKYKKIFNDSVINFHVFVGKNNVTVGTPIIYGSF